PNGLGDHREPLGRTRGGALPRRRRDPACWRARLRLSQRPAPVRVLSGPALSSRNPPGASITSRCLTLGSEPGAGLSVSRVTVSARPQGIPNAIAHELAAESKPAVCEAIVRREIHQALSDLADAGDRAERELQEAKAAAASGSG